MAKTILNFHFDCLNPSLIEYQKDRTNIMIWTNMFSVPHKKRNLTGNMNQSPRWKIPSKSFSICISSILLIGRFNPTTYNPLQKPDVLDGYSSCILVSLSTTEENNTWNSESGPHLFSPWWWTPKAATSFRFNGTPWPLSIWTMRYRPSFVLQVGPDLISICCPEVPGPANVPSKWPPGNMVVPDVGSSSEIRISTFLALAPASWLPTLL